MPNWKSTIKIGDLHKAYQAGEMTIQEVGKAVESRAMTNRFVRAEVDEGFDLTDAMHCLRAGVSDVAEYDDCLKALYDFGDDNHNIWIDTF